MMRANLLTRSLQNLGFQALPFALAVISLPLLNKHWPLEAIGQLSLVWVLMNYFQFFDFGLGRALTTRISHLISVRNEKNANILAGLALKISALLSLVFVGISYLLVRRFWPEISTAFICGLVPVLMMTNLLRGVLEGHQKFLSVNLLNTVLASSNFLIPALVALSGEDLSASLQYLFLFRLACLLTWSALSQSYFTLNGHDSTMVKDLIRFGGWISVANLIGPLMTSFDRFALNTGELKTDLALYSTPQEFISRLWVIPQAVCRSLVPAFSQKEMSEEIAEIFHRGLFWIRIVMIPACGFLFFFSHEIFFLWLGKAWASSEIITQILCLGILFNSANWVSFSFLQSRGRESATAKIPIIEFIIYVPLFIFGLKFWGLPGVAMAWSLRLCLDYSFFSYYTATHFGSLKKTLGQASLILSAVTLIFLCSLPFELGLGARVGLFFVSLLLWIALEFGLQGQTHIIRRLHLKA